MWIGADCSECYSKRIEFLEKENAALREIADAVAHIGFDFGYGPYELEEKFIEMAVKALNMQSMNEFSDDECSARNEENNLKTC